MLFEDDLGIWSWREKNEQIPSFQLFVTVIVKNFHTMDIFSVE